MLAKGAAEEQAAEVAAEYLLAHASLKKSKGAKSAVKEAEAAKAEAEAAKAEAEAAMIEAMAAVEIAEKELKRADEEKTRMDALLGPASNHLVHEGRRSYSYEMYTAYRHNTRMADGITREERRAAGISSGIVPRDLGSPVNKHFREMVFPLERLDALLNADFVVADATNVQDRAMILNYTRGIRSPAELQAPPEPAPSHQLAADIALEKRLGGWLTHGRLYDVIARQALFPSEQLDIYLTKLGKCGLCKLELDLESNSGDDATVVERLVGLQDPQTIERIKVTSEGLIYLPPALGTFAKLEVLDLHHCTSLISLPETAGGCTNLQILILYGCSSLIRLPNSMAACEALTRIDLSWCSKLISLPADATWPRLEQLNLAGCAVPLPSIMVARQAKGQGLTIQGQRMQRDLTRAQLESQLKERKSRAEAHVVARQTAQVIAIEEAKAQEEAAAAAAAEEEARQQAAEEAARLEEERAAQAELDAKERAKAAEEARKAALSREEREAEAALQVEMKEAGVSTKDELVALRADEEALWGG